MSLLLQGSTLGFAARLAGVQRPPGSQALSSATLEGGEPPREVVQFRVYEASQAMVGPLAGIEWPDEVRLIEVCRDDHIVEVERLRAGDLVTVVATEAALPELEVLFGPPAPVGELTLDPSASIGDPVRVLRRDAAGGCRSCDEAHRVRGAAGCTTAPRPATSST